MTAMSQKSEHVAYEILALGFRSYPRSVLSGFGFACLVVAYMWPGMPHTFLAAWLGSIVAISVLRLWLSHAFMRARPPADELGKWRRYAALVYGCTGLAWGILGAAAIHF